MNGGNVLPIYDPPREKTYRAAVAQVVRDLRAKHNLSPAELAERIGCCKETVENADGKTNNLNPVTLLRIGYEFGEDALAPVLELVRCRYQQPKTLAERFAEIQNELAAIAKAMDAA